MSIHRWPLPVLCSALLLVACGASSSSSTSPAPSTATPSTTGWTVGTAQGVATDQRCTTTAAVASLRAVGIALNDLVGMTLDRTTLGAAGAQWNPGMYRGFLENQELADFGYGGAGGCDKLASTGRVTGYGDQWLSEENTLVGSQVDLFLSEKGAADYLAWYPTLMKVGDSAGDGKTVSKVTTTPIPSLGPGAVLVDIVANGWVVREVAFQVKNVVGSLSAGASAADQWPVDPQKLATAAQAKVASATVTSAPLDAVVAMSVPLQRTDFPADLASVPFETYFGGTLDPYDSSTMSSDQAAAAARNAANGFLYSARGFYMGNDQVPKVSSGVSVYATAGGAAADRKASIDSALKGDSETSAATLFDVGIPGAVGWTRTVNGGEGGTTFVDTRILLPVDGQLLPFVFIHDTAGKDRRADVVRMAKKLLARIQLVTGV